MINGAKKLSSGLIYVADKKHDHYLQVLTSCCGTYSTYSEGELVCKRCWQLVELGEGDGSWYLQKGEL